MRPMGASPYTWAGRILKACHRADTSSSCGASMQTRSSSTSPWVMRANGATSPSRTSCSARRPRRRSTSTTEIHLGVPGDTTSAIVNGVEAQYSVPEGIAHVACYFTLPNALKPNEYDPFSFKCSVKGIKAPHIGTEVSSFTRNSVRLARAMMLMAGMDPEVDFISDDWAVAQFQAGVDLTLGMAQATPAPTVAQAPYGTPSGGVEDGVYRTGYTWVTAGVESKISPWSGIVVVSPGPGSSRILRTSSITAGPVGTTARKVYRQKRAQSANSWGIIKYCGEIPDNVTTTFDDYHNTGLLDDGEALTSDALQKWTVDLRIDTQDTLEVQVGNVLDHCQRSPPARQRAVWRLARRAARHRARYRFQRNQVQGLRRRREHDHRVLFHRARAERGSERRHDRLPGRSRRLHRRFHLRAGGAARGHGLDREAVLPPWLHVAAAGAARRDQALRAAPPQPRHRRHRVDGRNFTARGRACKSRVPPPAPR